MLISVTIFSEKARRFRLSIPPQKNENRADVATALLKNYSHSSTCQITYLRKLGLKKNKFYNRWFLKEKGISFLLFQTRFSDVRKKCKLHTSVNRTSLFDIHWLPGLSRIGKQKQKFEA